MNTNDLGKEVPYATTDHSCRQVTPDATFIGPPDPRPDRSLHLPNQVAVAGHPTVETFQQAALRWFELGLQVIPIAPGTKHNAIK